MVRLTNRGDGRLTMRVETVATCGGAAYAKPVRRHPNRPQTAGMRKLAVTAYAIVAILTTGCERIVNEDALGHADRIFALKRACHELGKARLAEDGRQDPGPGFVHSAEWCYSEQLNTCLYAGERHDLRFDKIGLFFATIDLLTNENLIVYTNLKSDDQAAVQAYTSQRNALLAQCKEPAPLR